jgi:hypothetical protein
MTAPFFLSALSWWQWALLTGASVTASAAAIACHRRDRRRIR